jgi:hypothetical protein
MKRFFISLLFLACAALNCSAQIQWRVSFKIILDSNGNRPNTGSMTCEEYIRDKVNWANDFYRQWGRGYQFTITEIVELPGHGGLFNADPSSGTENQKIYDAAQNNPTSYKWRSNAINVYLDNVPGSNSASDFASTILIGREIEINAFAHECGHYLGLCHTHGCACGNECSGACAGPVSDNIQDTIPDMACWTRDQVSNNYYNVNYASLTTNQKANFDHTFENLMSYHRPRSYLTSDQLDEITDKSNGDVVNIVTGLTWFVDKDNTCTSRTGSSSCVGGAGGPYQTVTTAVNRATGGDIVLLRPGNYNEPMTITKAITFRATRGNAIIGKN